MTEVKSTAPEAEQGFPAWVRGNTDRGGPHFGDLIDRIRDVMDAARFVSPTDELALELIDDLTRVAAKMEAVAVPPDEAPADTRRDLPSRGNVALPPTIIESEGPEGVVATATFRDFHLGRKAAHGGAVSLLFDELSGSAVMQRVSHGTFPRTAFIKVDYRSLTPVGRPLTVKVWVERKEGRKLFVLGTLHDGDTLCAEMNGLFLEVAMETVLD